MALNVKKMSLLKRDETSLIQKLEVHITYQYKANTLEKLNSPV